MVEAGRRSGTLSTASAAATLGRVLMAVPGPVTSALSVGCHLLLSTGAAVLVTGADDVLTVLGERSPAPPPADPQPSKDHPTDGLEPEVARVYEALPRRGVVTVAQLSAESALPAPQVMQGLAVLELHQLVSRHDGAWRRRRSSDTS